jgi:hypothetical protein
VLSYRHRRPGQEWESKEYPVLLKRTCCHYGGERVWFRCPALECGRRVAILYGGAVYACPHCYRLAYQSQRESFSDRAATRVEAIRERLGVVCQEVVVVETCSADGRLLVETGVRPVPVVLVGPGWE